jgi:hypothetical protein
VRIQGTATEKRYPALLTALAAVLALPFYMGLVHVPLAQMFVYSGVASTAMAAGQFVDTPREERGDAHVFVAELGLWFAAIVLFGGLSYLIALIF